MLIKFFIPDSHELQTCDWPRNVGCGESGGSQQGVSTVRVTDTRTGSREQQGGNSWRSASTPATPSTRQMQSQRAQHNPAPQVHIFHNTSLTCVEFANE